MALYSVLIISLLLLVSSFLTISHHPIQHFGEREPEIPHHRGIIQLDTKENQIEKFHLFNPGEL